MNTPNKLTILRVLLVPIMVVIAMIDMPFNIFGIPGNMIIVDILFVMGAITDKVDGTLARKNNQVTTFGKFLDPIADKILVISALIILVEKAKIPSWIPIIIIVREFAVSGYRLIAVEKNGKVIAANIWGKLKTVTQMFAIMLAFIDVNKFAECFMKNPQTLGIIPYIINLLTTILMIVCVIATIFSGYEYMKDGKDLLKD